jgi:hypothetical protein
MLIYALLFVCGCLPQVYKQQNSKTHMEYTAQYNYRPEDLSIKQDQIIQLVAQYVGYSRDPSQLQFKVIERTNHNHNFTFLKEGDKAYNYYSFLLHTHIGRAQAGYKNERYQRDQFSADYAQQLQQQEAALASTYHGSVVDVGTHYGAEAQTVSIPSARTTDEPPQKSARVETPVLQRPTATQNEEEDDDDDDAPAFKIIVDENGVQRVVRN